MYGQPGYVHKEHQKEKLRSQLCKNRYGKYVGNNLENFEALVVGPLVNLVALVKSKMGQGYSKSVRFSGRSFMIPFLAIRFSMVIET